MSSYATGSDLIARYDIDLIGDLATDDRETLPREEVATAEKVLVALADASGEVEVSLLAGGQYSVDDLTALTGNSLNHLKQIVCALAIAALYRRRPEAADREHIESITKDAREALRALRRGENIFGIQKAIEASLVDVAGPTAIDIQSRNDLSARMGRFFPDAATRLPDRQR